MELNETNPIEDDVVGAPEDVTQRPADPAQEQEWVRVATEVTGNGEVPEDELPELIDLELEHLREYQDEG